MADKRGNIQFQESEERPKVASHDSTILDLAFVMDCTGSMGSYIKQAQQNIRRIVEEIVAKEKSDIHLALVEYRDHPPQEKSFVTRVHDFTGSVKEMKTWLEAASASGGGDTPEAVADAWQALLKMTWREEATKICVHIADAPPHGLIPSGDSFPDGCPDGIDPVVVMNELAAKGVTLYMVGCEPSVKHSRPFYMAMAHLTGGQYVPLKNATLLTKVIIGGAEEELSLEKLMADAEAEIEKERQENGGVVDEEAVTRRIQTSSKKKGSRTTTLCYKTSPMPAVPQYAQDMSKMRSLTGIRSAMKDVPTERTYSDLETSGSRVNSRHSGDGVMFGATRGAEAEADSTPAELDDFTVAEEDLNMAQAQRLYNKAIHRKKKKASDPSFTDADVD